jgi:gliding motility-associated-like protein
VKRTIKISLFIVFLCGGWYGGYAQDLCNNSSFEAGSFDASSSPVCVPNVLTLTDRSGGNNIKYIFDYNGESLETALAIARPINTFIYFGVSIPEVFKVLQIGTKNGKTMVACKEIGVKPSNIPVYSYSVCGTNTLEINIPINLLNDYDQYKVELGTPEASILVSKNDLPYSIKKNLPLPRLIKVTGIYNDVTKNCPNGVVSVSVARPTVNPLGIDRPFAPNITRLELVQPTKAKIDFVGAFATEPTEQYQLYRHLKGNLATPTAGSEIIKDIKPGQHFVDIPDPTRAYCFFVQRKDMCTTAIPERSPEICTHPLKTVNFVPRQYQLSWDTYPDKLFNLPNVPIFGSYLTSIQYIQRTENTNAIRINKTPLQNIHNDNNIDCKKRYCYQVIQRTNGNYRYVRYAGESISNQICVDRSAIIPPKITDGWVSTDAANLNKLEYNRNTTWPLRPEKWLLHKDNGTNYIKIDSALSAIRVLNDKTPIKKSENYKIGYIDECNSVSALSNPISSVFLTYSLPNVLNWTKNPPFSNSKVQEFNLIPINELVAGNGPSVKILKTDFTTKANIELNEKEAKFFLETVSDSIPARVSTSNIVTIPIIPQIYIPDTFTPNGDLANDDLKIFGKTKRMTSFKFELFDRTGAKVYENTDLTYKWDGTINGKPIPQSTYVYIIKAKLDDGQVYVKKGSFDIIR